MTWWKRATTYLTNCLWALPLFLFASRLFTGTLFAFLPACLISGMVAALIVALTEKRRWVWGLTGLALVLLGTYYALRAYALWPFLLLVAALWYIANMTLFRKSGKEQDNSAMLGAVWYISIWAASFLLDYMDLHQLLGWLGVPYLIYILFRMQARSIDTASFERRESVPRGLRASNRLILSVVALAMLGLVFFRQLRVAFGFILLHIVRFALWLAEVLSPTRPGADGVPGAANNNMMMMEEGQGGLLSTILNVLFYVVGIAALVAATVLMFYAIYRAVRNLVRRLRAWARALDTDPDYVDERVSIDAQTDARRGSGSVGRRRGRGARDMDNREKVRYAYRMVMKRLRRQAPDVNVRGSATQVLEAATLGDADRALFLRSYWAARYDDRPISDAEAENARRAQRP